MHIFLSLIKHSFDIIGISEHKVNKKLINIDFNLPGYVFWNNKIESSHGEAVFFVSNKLICKKWPDLVINEAGKLESTFIELVLPNKRNIVYWCVYKHPSIEAKFSYIVTPLISRINKEEKIYLVIGDFNINLLNSDTKL